MADFCWFTSYIGYPNFFKDAGNSYELAQAFITFCDASISGKTYKESKGLFPGLDASQVETKKAAFQEFGLLYVVPRSDELSITPLGQQIYAIYKDGSIPPDKKRRRILLALCNALANYQFNNPFPVGGNRYSGRASSTDVKPYLCLYFLLVKLDGFITVSELMGIVFGIQNMADIPAAIRDILKHRASGTMPKPLNCLPKNRGTRNNLKIYLMAHTSLDNEVIVSENADIYAANEQAYEMTQFGSEIISSVLNSNWPEWNKKKYKIPSTKAFASIEDYFENGIGPVVSEHSFKKDNRFAQKITKTKSKGVVELDDIENLKQLPVRQFEEGRRRLVSHSKIEKVRNPALVRQAKKIFKITNGRLFCEVCGFDFEDVYGVKGKNFIEAHHNRPISEIKSRITLTIDDLTMVCSNCHRMLHKPPWISVEDLKKLISS